MDTRCEVAKSGMRKLALVGIAGACLWASAANSATISIAIGVAPVLVAGPNAGGAAFLGSSGIFDVVSVGALGNNNELGTQTVQLQNDGGQAGSIVIWVTSQGLTSGALADNFTSSFTSNVLPAGWSVLEQTFVDNANGLWSGVLLSQFTFNAIGTNVQAALFAADNLFSVTHKYTITANALAGLANSTINLAFSEVPLPGALPLFAGGLVGLWALMRRRKKVASAKPLDRLAA